jgi:hypothetical protein
MAEPNSRQYNNRKRIETGRQKRTIDQEDGEIWVTQIAQTQAANLGVSDSPQNEN